MSPEEPFCQREPVPRWRQRLYLIIEAPLSAFFFGLFTAFALFFGLLALDNFIPGLPWMRDKTEIVQVLSIAIDGGILVAKLTLLVYLAVCVYPPVRFAR